MSTGIHERLAGSGNIHQIVIRKYIEFYVILKTFFFIPSNTVLKYSISIKQHLHFKLILEKRKTSHVIMKTIKERLTSLKCQELKSKPVCRETSYKTLSP